MMLPGKTFHQVGAIEMGLELPLLRMHYPVMNGMFEKPQGFFFIIVREYPFNFHQVPFIEGDNRFFNFQHGNLPYGKDSSSTTVS